MSTIIKNGTIVTADLTYRADVLIEDGAITQIGPDLKGDEQLDATGCYVMPGGIDPHTHLEMPFMGTYSSDDFESGTRAALSGGPRSRCADAPQTLTMDADRGAHRVLCQAGGWGGQQGAPPLLGATDPDLRTRFGYRGRPLLGEARLWQSRRDGWQRRWSEGFGRVGGGTEVGRGLA